MPSVGVYRGGFRLGATVLALASLTACGSGTSDDAVSVDSETLTVFAASSLRNAFLAVGDAFMATNPNVTITFNFAASSELVTQIANGAPADVVATSDTSIMSRLTSGGSLRTEPLVFTTNRLMIIVGAGNPKTITDVSALSNPDLVVIACAPEVPCGAYARTVLDNAGVSITFKSLEENVSAVVSKVTLGEADAGIVYVTDVLGAGAAAQGIAIPANINVEAEYPVAITTDADDPVAAQAFVDFLMSDEGRSVLESFGFVSP